MKSNLLLLTIFNAILKIIFSIEFINQYGKTTISPTDEYIYFNSTNFKIGDKIYFKITSTTFKESYISFEFFDDDFPLENYNPGIQDKTYRTKEIDNKNEGKTYYYTITKDSKYLGNLEGKYLTIYFYCNGENVVIENYDKSSGKVPLYIIIIFAIVAVLGSGIFFFIYCFRKKRLSRINPNYIGRIPNNNYNPENNNNEGLGQSSIMPIPNSRNNNKNMNMSKKKTNITDNITIYNRSNSNNSRLYNNNFHQSSTHRKKKRGKSKISSKPKNNNQ